VNGRDLDGDTPGYAALDLGAVVTPSRGPLAVRARLEKVQLLRHRLKIFPAQHSRRHRSGQPLPGMGTLH
jgi:hypothetical protein